MWLKKRYVGSVLLLELDAPPVNAFSLGLRRALLEAFTAMASDVAAEAIVLHGGGNGFSAGGDRAEFGTPAAVARPTLSRDVLGALERCTKPVVAAMHGFAVGGGLELALACDARVVVADTRVGFPEVTIGRIPLSGSQRLPRLLGFEAAAEWMMRGDIVPAGSSGISALFDQVIGDRQLLLPAACEIARSAVQSRPCRVSDRPFKDHDPRAALRAVLDRFPLVQCTAPQRTLLEALLAAVESENFQSGLDRAQVLFDRLVEGSRTS